MSKAERAALHDEAVSAREQARIDARERLEQVRIDARQNMESRRAPSGYRWNASGNLEPIPGGPGDKKDKPLAGAVLKQIQETRDNAKTIANLTSSFKDDFASKGILGIGADAQMSASATFGKDKEAVAWWKNYKKQSELVERHAMFGASLTPGEQESWRSADISPGMDADVIKTNLQTRAELAKNMLETTRQDFIDAGHSEERVNSIAGRTNLTTVKPVATSGVIDFGSLK